MDRREFLNLGGIGLAGSLNAQLDGTHAGEPGSTAHYAWLQFVETSGAFENYKTVTPVDWMAAEFLGGVCELFLSASGVYPERDVTLRLPSTRAGTVVQVCGEIQSTSDLQHWPSVGRTSMAVTFLEPAAVTVYLPKKGQLEIVVVAKRPR